VTADRSSIDGWLYKLEKAADEHEVGDVNRRFVFRQILGKAWDDGRERGYYDGLDDAQHAKYAAEEAARKAAKEASQPESASPREVHAILTYDPNDTVESLRLQVSEARWWARHNYESPRCHHACDHPEPPEWMTGGHPNKCGDDCTALAPLLTEQDGERP
jgi:hypothetical protein